MNRTYFRSVFGAVLFIAAIVFCGISMGLWQFSFELSSAWTFIIIIPMIIWLFISGANILNSAGFFTGFGLLLYNNGFIYNDRIVEFIVSLVCMTIGLTVFGRIGKETFDADLLKRPKRTISQEQIFLKSTLISSNNVNTAENIIGGTIQANLCDIAYDMRTMKLKHPVDLTVGACCGNIVLIIPKGCNLVLNSNCSFGKVINKTKESPDGDSFTVTLKAKVTFGKILILD